jgi:hypothetical protein
MDKDKDKDKKAEPVSVVPEDVAAELKKGGWATITGIWKKKAPNVYEVSDGTLESPFMTGAMQVIVYTGGKGSVKATVRDTKPDDDGQVYKLKRPDPNNQGQGNTSSYTVASGYGVSVEGDKYKVFGPFSINPWVDSKTPLFRPYVERESKLPPGAVKNQFLITIDKQMSIMVNGEKKKTTSVKLTEEGTFLVKISGTMIIEAPVAKGQ